MPLWAWLVIAVVAGLLVGVEAWAWMRHHVSAIVLAVSGVFGLGAALLGVTLAAIIAYGILGGISGVDPVGLLDDTTEEARAGGASCDSNYEGQCLDPDAYDYDCEGGSGDGPQYAGVVHVVGVDVHDLDRDGDGTGCD